MLRSKISNAAYSFIFKTRHFKWWIFKIQMSVNSAPFQLMKIISFKNNNKPLSHGINMLEEEKKIQ